VITRTVVIQPLTDDISKLIIDLKLKDTDKLENNRKMKKAAELIAFESKII
jgi:hypothetical protein